MSASHQIYLRLPEKRDQLRRTVGIYQHTVWGQRCLSSLSRFFDWYTAGNEYRDMYLSSEAAEIMIHIWSCDPDSGYFHSYITEIKDCTEPDIHQNDTGITLIDLVNPDSPGYCFMFLQKSTGYPKLTALNAHDYLRFYYSQYETETIRLDKAYDPPREDDWTEFHAHSKSLVEKLSNFRVLSDSEAKRFFLKLKGTK